MASVLFQDTFATLSLYDWRNPSAGGTWEPADWYSPVDDGVDVNGSWLINPFNPATPLNGGPNNNAVMHVANGTLHLACTKTPAAIQAACGGDTMLGARLQTDFAGAFQFKKGYIEWRSRLPKLVPYTSGALWLWDATGQTKFEVDGPEFDIYADHHNCLLKLYDGGHNSVGSTTIEEHISGFDPTVAHRYGIDVMTKDNKVHWYVDGVDIFSLTAPSGLGTVPLAILWRCMLDQVG